MSDKKTAVASAGAGGAIASVGGITATAGGATPAVGGVVASKKGIESLAWIKGSKGGKPEHSVSGGTDKDQRSMYVARSTRDGDLLPGKLILGHLHNITYVAKDGKEHGCSDYEVLTNPGKLNLTWVSTKKGSSTPAGAVPGGKTKSGEALFIGRHGMHGFQALGTVYSSTKRLHLPWHGLEYKFDEYEILVSKD